MKPSIRSTGLAFLLVGLGVAAWGFVGLLPSPIQIGAGAALALTGLGLFFRARLAHNAGLVLASAGTGLGGWNLYHAMEGSQRLAAIKAGLMLAVGLYLLVSLVVTRAHFARAKQ
jgi:hypothetical protein